MNLPAVQTEVLEGADRGQAYVCSLPSDTCNCLVHVHTGDQRSDVIGAELLYIAHTLGLHKLGKLGRVFTCLSLFSIPWEIILARYFVHL